MNYTTIGSEPKLNFGHYIEIKKKITQFKIGITEERKKEAQGL